MDGMFFKRHEKNVLIAIFMAKATLLKPGIFE